MPFESFNDIQYELDETEKRFLNRYAGLKIDRLEEENIQYRKQLEDSAIWTDESRRSEVQDIQAKLSALEKKLSGWQNLKLEIADLREYVEIAKMEKDTSLLPELSEKYYSIKTKFDALDLESLLSGDDDHRNAFLNIHPGAGGTESHDWADLLYRMYLRWAEKKGYEVDLIDYQEGEEAGIKNVTLLIKGINAYGYIKAENGIHRLVRISPFDSNKRRHTSFASVHVSPEISDDVEVDINEKDLRIDTYRSSGAGGQHINKTDSAVRITHEPTGVVVAVQNERSQIKNKSTAMKMLRARLYELAREEKQKEIDSKSGERKDISWGNQIRSYVFHPYNLVKDTRTGYETGNIQAVMDGDLDKFIDAYLRMMSSLQQTAG